MPAGNRYRSATWALWVSRALAAVLLGVGFVAASHAAEVTILAQESWIEDGRQATIGQVSSRRVGQFDPTTENAIYAVGPESTLWLRLKLQATRAESPNWALDIPVPLIDYVVLYQQDADGKWQSQSAGDNLPVSAWQRPGRYPSFDLALPAGTPRTVYLQLRHSDPIGFPLRLGPAAAQEQTRQVEYLVLGAILGTLVLLTVWCLIQGGIHRDAAYAWYAAYAATMTLTMATVTGISAHLLWNESPRWADAAQGVLPVLLAGVNVLFLRHLCGTAARNPRVGHAAMALGVVILALGFVFLAVDSRTQTNIVAFSLIASPVISFVMAALAWRRHDVVGGWVILAYIPLATTAIVAVLRLHGWVAASWLTLDASAAASAAAVPLLLLALNARSRDRHAVKTRVNKVTEQDALTGLLSATAMERQLKVAVSGAIMRRQAAAVVVVEIVNLEHIREFHGDAMAEQCVLRAAIKLHRVVRDSDPAGRIATGRFALIFEGVSSRDEVQERMVRLVASGLVPARGAKVEVPLRFHAACLLLSEKILTTELILRDLTRVLAAMSPRTRRPVRFLEVPHERHRPPRPPHAGPDSVTQPALLDPLRRLGKGGEG